MPSRRPRGYLIAGGQRIPAIGIGVTQSRTKSSDQFTANVAIGGDSPDMSFWTDRDTIDIQVMFQNDEGEQQEKMFDGFVDTVQIQMLARTITLSGRDKSQKLVDTRMQKKYLNKKPDEIIREEAEKVGLKTDLAKFQDKAGKKWQIDWNKFVHNESLWSLINRLADNFGFNAYSTVGTLYVKEFNERLEVYPIHYRQPDDQHLASGDFIDMQMTRNMPLARGVSSKVTSWNSKQKKIIRGKAGRDGGAGLSSPLEYNLTVPGLQQSQADRLARKRYAEATSHKMTLSIDMPGDTAMNSRKSIQLSGTETIFDTRFDVQSVDHRINTHDGYRMFIQARLPGDDDNGGGGNGSGGDDGNAGGDNSAWDDGSQHLPETGIGSGENLGSAIPVPPTRPSGL